MSEDQLPPPSGEERPKPSPAAGGGPRLTEGPLREADAPQPRPSEAGTGPATGPADNSGPAGDPDPGTAAGSPGGPAGAGAGGGWQSAIVRSRRHRIVGGVCGGLGRYFDLDPVVFRVPLAVLSLIGGLGLVFYGFAWLLLPAEGERENELSRLLSGRVEGTSLSAVLVALVGCGLFLASLRAGYTSFSLLVAGAVAAAAYWSQRRRRAEAVGAGGTPADPATAHAVADAPPEAQAPPVPSSPSWWRDPLTKDGADARGTGYLWGPDDEASCAAREEAADRRRTRRERRSYGGPVFVLAQVVAVVAGGVALGSRPVSDSLVIAFACALLVYGAAFVVASFFGRLGGGTVFAVVLTATGLVAASVLPQDITADWEERRWTPPTAVAVRPSYEQGTGRGTLDLTAVRPGGGETVRTRVRVGAGELRVLVPDDVVVRMDYEIGVGGYRFPDPPDGAAGEAGPAAGDDGPPGAAAHRGDGGGLGVSGSRTLRPAGGGSAYGRLLLDLDVGVGEVVVLRREAVAP